MIIKNTLNNTKNIVLLILLSGVFLFFPKVSNANTIILIKDNEIEDFIIDLFHPIKQAANVPYGVNLYIVNDQSINAFVMGGNNMFINLGLIAEAKNYNEIAGVLAHELGHITAGHLSRAQLAYDNAQLLMVLSTVGIFATAAAAISSGSANSNSAELVGFLSYSASHISNAAILEYSRSEESAADQLAADYLAKTDYSITGLVDFMERLSERSSGFPSGLEWYSTHPLSADRASFLQNYIEKMDSNKGYSKNSNLQQRLERIQDKITAYNTDRYANISSETKEHSINYIQAIHNYKNYNYEEALKFINLDIEQTNSIYSIEMKGDILVQLQRFPEAIVEFNKYLSEKNNNIIYYKLARAYFLDNEYESAMSALHTSIQYDRKNPSAWHLKSLIHGMNSEKGLANLALAEKNLIIGNPVQAKQFAERAVQTLPKDSKDYQTALQIINNSN